MSENILLIIEITCFIINLVCFIVNPTIALGIFLAITSLCTGCSVALNLIGRRFKR